MLQATVWFVELQCYRTQRGSGPILYSGSTYISEDVQYKLCRAANTIEEGYMHNDDLPPDDSIFSHIRVVFVNWVVAHKEPSYDRITRTSLSCMSCTASRESNVDNDWVAVVCNLISSQEHEQPKRMKLYPRSKNSTVAIPIVPSPEWEQKILQP